MTRVSLELQVLSSNLGRTGNKFLFQSFSSLGNLLVYFPHGSMSWVVNCYLVNSIYTSLFNGQNQHFYYRFNEKVIFKLRTTSKHINQTFQIQLLYKKISYFIGITCCYLRNLSAIFLYLNTNVLTLLSSQPTYSKIQRYLWTFPELKI